MKIQIDISNEDIAKIRNIVEKHKNNPGVLERVDRNVSNKQITFNKEIFWKCLITCLTTTQQKSGPGTKIELFRQLNPYPLNYELCKKSENLENFAYNLLKEFGGIRMYPKLSKQIAMNFKWLEEGGWDDIRGYFDSLASLRINSPSSENRNVERSACVFIQDYLKGIGPKQSRNLWQMLGLTRYETPIDSRVIKWFNKNHIFPFVLSSKGLTDENYYGFILDLIQELCLRSEVLPCVLDACIFFDLQK